MTVKFYTEARSAVRAARNATEKLPEDIFVTGIEPIRHAPEQFGGSPRFAARIYFDHEDLRCLLPHAELLTGFELVSERKEEPREEKPEPKAEKPEPKAQRATSENRRTRRVLKDTAVLAPTGNNSGIGKGIHLTITNAFDGVKPLSQVVEELRASLEPPRAKGWEEDPVRYIREYVSYNLGQGALTVVSD